MIKDDPSDFPAPPPAPKQKGALAIGKDELKEADTLIHTDDAMFHAMLAIGYLLVAMVERLDQVIEPDFQEKNGTVVSHIRTGGKA